MSCRFFRRAEDCIVAFAVRCLLINLVMLLSWLICWLLWLSVAVWVLEPLVLREELGKVSRELMELYGAEK